MPARVIYEADDEFPDGSRYEMIVTTVPVSEDYPEGIKYRFQYMDTNDDLLLRFDNFPHHPDVRRHHYHTPEGVFASAASEGSSNSFDGVFDDLEFVDLDSHVETFETAVDAIHGGADLHG